MVHGRSEHHWIQRQDNSTFSMRFRVESMDILNKRNKNNDPCRDDWKNYDFDILTEHVEEIKCRAPYHILSDQFPFCSTNEQLKRARAFSLSSGIIDDLTHPCKIAEKISYTYEEGDSEGTGRFSLNEFWISLYFYNRRYKEITQTR